MTSLILYSLFFYLSFTNVGAGAAAAAGAAANSKASLVGTAANSKVSLVRYWNIQISNDLPKPWFLLNKASPLTAVESETFSELANDPNAIADQLRSLCSSANLFCFPDLSLGHGETYVRDGGDVNVDCCFFYRYKGGKKSPPPSPSSMGMTTMAHRGKAVKTWVEPGIFFRERMLTSGTIMRMPDIRDKTPKRSFLPRVVSTKLPFSTSKIPEMRKIYQAAENSTMAIMLAAAVTNCERAPSAGEKKRCVGCVEDMMDFAISILGRNLTVLTTLNDAGSKNNVKIGKARAIINGTAISCHQILFPYLLYYCHSVPEVRVYQAEILDPNTNIKINHAVALCHLDTSSWSSDHGAFLALGSGPGKIEVCHWVFQNDMAWVQIY